MPSLDVLKRLFIWLVFSLILFTSLFVLLSDVEKAKTLILSISVYWFPAIMGAVVFNYCLRFVKWEYFLSRLGLKITKKDSLWIFFSAFTMILSPGKLGEVIKSVFLRARYEIPMSKSAPIVMAERLTDLLGLMLLSAIGCSRFAYGTTTLSGLGGVIFLSVFLITRSWFWNFWDQKILSRFSAFAKIRGSFKVLEESTSNLLTVPAMLFTVPLSAVSWAGEGVALYLIFLALEVEKPGLLGISLFAHAFSSILGAFSFLPGGLFVTEGALSLFFIYVGIGREQAVSATFLIRALTLWFAVILGTIVFFWGRKPGDMDLEKGD